MMYGNLREEYCNVKDAQVVILPVPYDATGTWIKGADRGPAAIIEASANMELFDIETNSEAYRKGIFTHAPIGTGAAPEELVHAVRDKVGELIRQGKCAVVLGGEHSVSIGAIQAHAEMFPDMCVLQLDAHSDLRDEYNGSRLNHACVMARARESCPIVQVGVRSMDSSEWESMDRERIFFADDIRKNSAWVRDVVSLLTGKVYLTVDLDVFDPSIMPSTGTPEPGGLSWQEVLKLVREVTQQKELVGFDVVELCPNPQNKAPDFLASKLIYKILSYKYGNAKKKGRERKEEERKKSKSQNQKTKRQKEE